VSDAPPTAGAPAPRATHAALAAATLFFVNGATFSNWLPRITEIRDQLGLGNAGLGVTLLGGGLGGIIGAVAVGRLSERLGSARLLTIAAVTLSVGMPLIAFAPHAALLLVLLTVLGAFDVFNDVAMNAQGVMAQEQLDRPIMNRLHGMWSLGFTGGALVGSLARATEIPIEVHLVTVGALLLATTLVVRRWFIPVDAPHEPAATAAGTDDAPTRRRLRPDGPMIAMALAAIGAIALEVAPADWAAVLLTDEFDAGRLAGLGTVACAGAMLVGRLSGDHVLERVGETRLMNGAMWLVGAGLVVTVLAPATPMAVVGLMLWGLGLSVVFPQLYATAARLPGTSAGAGLGWMLLGQRFGSMLTAVSIGAVSQWQDVRIAFAVVGGVALVLMAGALHRGRQAVASGPLAEATPR
jgi:predicted MFS family arabinose efflux permease